MASKAPNLLKWLGGKKVEPIFLNVVDMSPDAGRTTDLEKARSYLESYGLKLATSSFFNGILASQGGELFLDYEGQYTTRDEIKTLGYPGIVSANLMGLTSLRILDNFIFDHPVFGECPIMLLCLL